MLRLCKEMFYVCFIFLLEKCIFFNSGFYRKLSCFFVGFQNIALYFKIKFFLCSIFLLVTLFIPPKS